MPKVGSRSPAAGARRSSSGSTRRLRVRGMARAPGRGGGGESAITLDDAAGPVDGRKRYVFAGPRPVGPQHPPATDFSFHLSSAATTRLLNSRPISLLPGSSADEHAAGEGATTEDADVLECRRLGARGEVLAQIDPHVSRRALPAADDQVRLGIPVGVLGGDAHAPAVRRVAR